jgi:hypothetical protein
MIVFPSALRTSLKTSEVACAVPDACSYAAAAD